MAQSSPSRIPTVAKPTPQIKDEQERVQKKTFTNWINTYLTVLKPSIRVRDLFKELQDGTILLSLLEILAETKLTKESPRNMQRVHFLSNIKKALDFLEKRKVKLVNINPADIADGKPNIILGLMWTIILHFQIEGQEEILAKVLGIDPSDAKIKGSAKKALLSWVENSLSNKYEIQIKDFMSSWRDGQGFNAMVHSIDSSLIDMESIKKMSNKARLDNAFETAEKHLGIAKLLDAEDVDVEKPDEKSIMTYVAQFLKSFPDGKKTSLDQKPTSKLPQRSDSEMDRISADFRRTLTSTTEWVNDICNQIADIDPSVYTKKDVSLKTASLNSISQRKFEFSTKFDKLTTKMNKAADQLGPDSRKGFQDQMDKLEKKWNDVQERIEAVKVQLKDRLNELARLASTEEELFDWLKSSDRRLKGYQSGSSMEEKKELLVKFGDSHKEVISKQKVVDDFVEENEKMSSNKSENQNVNEIKRLFKTLLNSSKEMFDRCTENFNKHKQFCTIQTEFKDLIAATKETCKVLESSASDKSTVTKKKTALEAFAKRRKEGEALLATLSKAGELLFSETGVKGVTELKRDIKRSKGDWEALLASVQAGEKELGDATDRLKSVEKELKDFKAKLDSFDTKLTSFKESLEGNTMEASQEIQSRFSDLEQEVETSTRLLSRLNSKTREIGDKAMLAEYQSLDKQCQSLLKRVKSGQDDVKERLVLHRQFGDGMEEFEAWYKSVDRRLRDCLQVTEDRSSIQLNWEKLKDLDKIISEADESLKPLATKAKKLGKASLKSLAALETTWKELLASLQSAQKQLTEKLKEMNDVDKECTTISSTLADIDTQIREMKLVATLEEKEDQLKRIVNFVKDSESAAVKLKQLKAKMGTADSRKLNQLTGKSKTLQETLSEHQNKWTQYISKHKALNSELQSVEKWINDFRNRFNKCVNAKIESKSDVDEKTIEVANLFQEQDNGFDLLSDLSQSMNSVIGSTSSSGQNIVRESVSDIKSLWDSTLADLATAKSKFQNTISNWDLYDNEAKACHQWIDDMQSNLQRNNVSGDSLSDKVAHVERLKIVFVGIVKYQGTIDDLQERANQLGSPSSKAHETSKEVQKHFAVLKKAAQSMVQAAEQATEEHQKYKQDYEGLLEEMRNTLENDLNPDTLDCDKERMQEKLKLLDNYQNGPESLKIRIENVIKKGQSLSSDKLSSGNSKLSNEIQRLEKESLKLFEGLQEQHKRLQSLQQKWTKYDKEHDKFFTWIKECEDKIKSEGEPHSNFDDKQSHLDAHIHKGEEIAQRSSDLERLNGLAKELLQNATDLKVTNQLALISARYNALNVSSKNLINRLQHNIEDHKEFIEALAKCESWLNDFSKEMDSIDKDKSDDKELLQKQLEKLEKLALRKDEGHAIVEAACSWGEKVLSTTSTRGKKRIKTDIDKISDKWDQQLQHLSKLKARQEGALIQWSEFDDGIETVQKWLKETERKLGTVELKESLSLKSISLQTAKTHLKSIISYRATIDAFAGKISSANLAAQSQIDQCKTKYEHVRRLAEANIKHVEASVVSHQNFTKRLSDLTGWINFQQEKLIQCRDSSGDLAALESHLRKAEELQEALNEGHKILPKVVQLGEETLGTTVVSGHSSIRQEMQLVRQDLDKYESDLEEVHSHLDICQKSAAEYQASHDALAKWIKASETKLVGEPKLQSTVSEKKAQINRFLQQNQDISSHQAELEAVLTKSTRTSEIVKSSSFSQSSTQIQSRFNALLNRSKDILKQVQTFHEDQIDLNNRINEFYDLTNLIRDSLAQLDAHSSASKDDLDQTRSFLTDLEGQIDDGENKFQVINDLTDKVASSTSQKGKRVLVEQLKKVKLELEKLKKLSKSNRSNLEKRVSNVVKFEGSCDQLDNWLNDTEDKLGRTDPSTLPELSDRMSALKRVTALKKEIEDKKIASEKMIEGAKDMGDSDLTTRVKGLNQRFVKILENCMSQTDFLKSSIVGQEDFSKAEKKISDWHQAAKRKLQALREFGKSKDKVKSKQVELQKLKNECEKTGKVLIRTLVQHSETISKANAPNADQVENSVKQWSQELDLLVAATQEIEDNFENLTQLWEDFSKSSRQFQKWYDVMNDKVGGLIDASTEGLDATLESTKQYEMLFEKMTDHKTELTHLSEIGEKLQAISVDPEVTRKITDFNQKYETLLTESKKVEDRLEVITRDQRSSEKAHKEASEWIETVTQKVLYCSDFTGRPALLQEKIEIIKNISKTTDEGHQLVLMATEAGTRLIEHLAGAKGVDSLTSRFADLKRNWSELEHQISQVKINLDTWAGKWIEYGELRDRLDQVLGEKQASADQLLASAAAELERGTLDMAEVNMQQERFKLAFEDIERSNADFRSLQKKSDELHCATAQKDVADDTKKLQERFTTLRNMIKSHLDNVSEVYKKQWAYRDAHQEIEKWILQTSFQLMNKNSTICPGLVEVSELNKEVNLLLKEITKRARDVEKVAKLGRVVIEDNRKEGEKGGGLEMINRVKEELDTMKTSYDNLKTTGAQIQVRLTEYLSQWKAFDKLVQNVDKFMSTELPNWWLGKDVIFTEGFDDAQREIVSCQETVKKLTNFRESMLSAAHRCEATVSLSDPPTGTTLAVAPVDVDSFGDSTLGRKAETLARNIDEQKGKLAKRLTGLQEAQEVWQTFEKEKEVFSNWLQSQKKMGQDILKKNARGKTPMDDRIKTMFEEYMTGLRKGEETLKELQNHHAELVIQHPTVVDKGLLALSNNYDRFCKTIQQRAKGETRSNSSGVDSMEFADKFDPIVPTTVTVTAAQKPSNDLQEQSERNEVFMLPKVKDYGIRNSGGNAGLSKRFWPYDCLDRDEDSQTPIDSLEYRAMSGGDSYYSELDFESFERDQSVGKVSHESTQTNKSKYVRATALRSLLNTVRDMKEEISANNQEPMPTENNRMLSQTSHRYKPYQPEVSHRPSTFEYVQQPVPSSERNGRQFSTLPRSHPRTIPYGETTYDFLYQPIFTPHSSGNFSSRVNRYRPSGTPEVAASQSVRPLELGADIEETVKETLFNSHANIKPKPQQQYPTPTVQSTPIAAGNERPRAKRVVNDFVCNYGDMLEDVGNTKRSFGLYSQLESTTSRQSIDRSYTGNPRESLRDSLQKASRTAQELKQMSCSLKQLNRR